VLNLREAEVEKARDVIAHQGVSRKRKNITEKVWILGNNGRAVKLRSI
jgi:hypothetical protein